MRPYLREYAGSLDVLRFQAMPAHGDSRYVYNARNFTNCDVRVGARIKWWVHWDGRGPDVQQDNAIWMFMPFLCCTKDCGYDDPVAETVAQYVDASSK